MSAVVLVGFLCPFMEQGPDQLWVQSVDLDGISVDVSQFIG
jgi:hypothetical protein